MNHDLICVAVSTACCLWAAARAGVLIKRNAPHRAIQTELRWAWAFFVLEVISIALSMGGHHVLS